MSEWHGWEKGGVALHVGPMPGRKSVALYVHAGTVITVLAYFRSEDDARTCLKWMDGELKRADITSAPLAVDYEADDAS